MASPKTRPTDANVDEFLAAVPDARRREDALAIDAMLRETTGERPVLWGTSIVGYGEVDHPGSGGKGATWPAIAFAVRKTELVLYLNTQLEAALFDGLGPHRRGVGCLYLKRLSDVDVDVLRDLLRRSVDAARS